MNKKLKTFLILIAAIFVVITVAIVFLPAQEPTPTPTPTPTLTTTSEIPEGYYLSWNEDKQDIAISCHFLTGINAYEDKVNFSLGTGEIWLGAEESFFLLNGNALSFTVRSENISSLALYEVRGPVLVTWDVVLYKYEDERDVLWDISWRAKMDPGKKILLPNGKEFDFWGFDPCTGNPQFSVIAG